MYNKFQIILNGSDSVPIFICGLNLEGQPRRGFSPDSRLLEGERCK